MLSAKRVFGRIYKKCPPDTIVFGAKDNGICGSPVPPQIPLSLAPKRMVSMGPLCPSDAIICGTKDNDICGVHALHGGRSPGGVKGGSNAERWLVNHSWETTPLRIVRVSVLRCMLNFILSSNIGALDFRLLCQDLAVNIFRPDGRTADPGREREGDR